MTADWSHRAYTHACNLYRPSGRFAYFFARGKLRGDPVFRALLQRGLLPSGGDFLDLGCGQGCWFAWLLAARHVHEEGAWPVEWPAPPLPQKLRGVELTAQDAQRAVKAFSPYRETVRIEQGDMCTTDLGRPDVVTVLDALHYVSHDLQETLLQRIHAALAPGGVFVTRVGDARGGWRYRLANGIDHTVSALRGYRGARLYGRALSEWRNLLEGIGFEVQAAPMSEGQPFANVMLVCRHSV